MKVEAKEGNYGGRNAKTCIPVAGELVKPSPTTEAKTIYRIHTFAQGRSIGSRVTFIDESFEINEADMRRKVITHPDMVKFRKKQFEAETRGLSKEEVQKYVEDPGYYPVVYRRETFGTEGGIQT